MNSVRVASRVSLLLAGTCLAGSILVPGAAMAQTKSEIEAPTGVAASSTQVTPNSQPAAPDDAAAGDIVITGSRIQKTGYDQPTPVTVQTSDALLASAPTSLPDALNRLPQFAGSRTRTFCCEVGSVGNYLNLRGLGTTRTLVLLDSRRVVATRESGDVDVNLLPELLIERIDVVTGGASAAYGSDAVSGVVNYVIDNRFQGFKVNAQTGVSTYGDDATYKLAGAFGTSFAGGRGRFVASVEYFDQGGIRSLDDRPLSSRNRGYFMGGNGSAATPYTALSGVYQATAAYGGVIVGPSNLPIPGAGAPLAGMQFLPGGATAPFVLGAPIPGSSGFYIGGDGILNNLADPAQSLNTGRGYARLSFDFSDRITGWIRTNLGRSRTQGDVLADNRQTTVAYTIFRDNAYLPGSVATQMDASGVSSFRLARFNRDFGPIHLDYTNKTWDVAGGFDGKIGTGWNWGVTFSHGETTLNSRVENVGDLSRIYAQADAVRDPASGQIVCRVTLTNPGLYPGCVPVNLFGEGSPSQAAKDYALRTSTQNVKNTQTVAAAELRGDLFNLPAGSVSVALGGEYRERSLREVSNAVALGQIQATGIRGFPTSLCPTATTCRFGGYQQGNFGEANARDNVKEGFVEALVPVLRDVPFFHELNLNGAFRYTDYKNSGGVSTWKVGASWAPVEGFRFRGTRSRDIRAPNLFELFAGPVNAFQPGLTDRATNTTNVIAITRTRGNPGLLPEKADSLTLGAVLNPRFLPGLSASVDYYDINIKGALSQTTSQATLDACFVGDQGACSRITRDASGAIQQITLLQINLNSRRVKGIDFDVSYNTSLGNGRLGARALVNRAINFIDTAGGIATEQVGYYNTANQLTVPKWRGNFNVTYDNGPFSLFVQERYIGSYAQMPPVPGVTFAKPVIDSVLYTDITGRLKISSSSGRDIELYASVNNLFNKLPPFIPNRFATNLGYPTPPGLYDIDDRYFTFGVRMKF
jgi:iron complex outermembrane receptor protein